jgi:hypothetical protein
VKVGHDWTSHMIDGYFTMLKFGVLVHDFLLCIE